jgi:two-component system CheB/CheR fusion protein
MMGDKPIAKELSPTVFLIDDDDALREAMRELIKRKGWPVEAFASGEAFLEANRPGRKGCLLVDARLPGLGGIALLQRLKEENHALPSIMITGHGDVSMAVEAMKAGAIDFIEKPVSPHKLLLAIESALKIARNSMELSARRDAAAKRIAKLTTRQREIMNLLIVGRTNESIAAEMNLSRRTVENHRSQILKRTGSKTLQDLIRLAIAVA